MFGLTSQHRFYLYPGVTDMRKSFNGLGGLIQNELHRSATSGEVFLFVNRRRNVSPRPTTSFKRNISVLSLLKKKSWTKEQ
jgi:hypothetical protein